MDKYEVVMKVKAIVTTDDENKLWYGDIELDEVSDIEVVKMYSVEEYIPEHDHDNAGCDCCGTYDRVEESKFCEGCKDQEDDDESDNAVCDNCGACDIDHCVCRSTGKEENRCSYCLETKDDCVMGRFCDYGTNCECGDAPEDNCECCADCNTRNTVDVIMRMNPFDRARLLRKKS